MDKPTYGKPEFSKPERATVFNGRNGSKSVLAVSVSVPVPMLGLKIEAAIWGRLTPTPTGNTVDFAASLPRHIKTIGARGTADADAAADAFCAHIENAVLRWTGYDGAMACAYATLTGTAVQPTTAKGAAVRPRLVYDPNAVRPAAQPEKAKGPDVKQPDATGLQTA